MSSVQRPPNQLLQAPPAAEFEALRPRLKPFEMVRDAVLAELGAASTHVYLPHSGAISIVLGLICARFSCRHKESRYDSSLG